MCAKQEGNNSVGSNKYHFKLSSLIKCPLMVLLKLNCKGKRKYLMFISSTDDLIYRMKYEKIQHPELTDCTIYSML